MYLFASIRLDSFSGWNPVVDSSSIGAASGEKANAGCRANGRGRIEVGASDALCCHAVEIGCSNVGVPIAGEIAVPKIVA